jgi:hypothetical protein
MFARRVLNFHAFSHSFMGAAWMEAWYSIARPPPALPSFEGDWGRRVASASGNLSSGFG